jgi:threonylcarbamoyladenosine tRNA methylthiotransferase MtaB
MRVRLETLGCRLNAGEMQRLARQFVAAGHRIAEPGTAFDVCVINTCAVTQIATRKSRQLIRHIHHAQPAALLVVTGCYAELEPAQTAALGVHLVVGNRQKDDLVGIVTRHVGAQQLTPHVDDGGSGRATGPCPDTRTRAFVKAQDGCDNHCTFCVVRLARGPARSRPADDVLTEVHQLARMGYREVVLSGVHLGSYGQDSGDEQGLFRLVQRLLRETDIPRLRLSSLEPWDLDIDFFQLWEDRRLGRHLHLPLQSGCDATLHRMGRRITSLAFAALVDAARTAIPDLSVTTDILVGFPGETETEFAASLAFVEAVQFAKLHVFRYSPRPGTPAASMPDQVPATTAVERSQQMHQVGARMEQAFRRRFVGRIMEVLWETGDQHGNEWQWHGLTENYLRVSAAGPPGLRNVIAPTRLVADTSDGLRGETLNEVVVRADARSGWPGRSRSPG